MKNILFILFLTLAAGCNPLGGERASEEPPQPTAQEPSPSPSTLSETSDPVATPEASAPAPQLEVAEPRRERARASEEVWNSMMRSARYNIDKSLAISRNEAFRLLSPVDLDCDPTDKSSWDEVTDRAHRQEILALADQFHSEHKVVIEFPDDHEDDYEDAVVYGYNSLDFSQFTEDICELTIRTQCAPSFDENRENGRLIEISWHPYGSQKACRENDGSDDEPRPLTWPREYREVCCDDTDAYIDGHMVHNYRYYLWASEDFRQGFGEAFDWSFGGAISKQPMRFASYRRGDDGQILVEGEFLWGDDMLPWRPEDMEQDSFRGVFESGRLNIIYRKSDHL